MARFDVYPNPVGPGWLLDVQTDLLEIIGTRVVVPLLPAKAAKVATARLNPEFEIEGERAVMVTQALAAVPTTALHERRTNLADHHAKIAGALDMLFLGF